MITLPKTKNETSFAIAFADATANFLDAMATVGQERRDAIQAAKRRLGDAANYTDVEYEFDAVTSLLFSIIRFERTEA